MKILYTLNSGSPGGMEQHVLDLVNQMVLRSHMVYIWCQTGVICDSYKKAGAKVTEIIIHHDIDPAYICKLKTFITKNEIDVVHAHELKAVANSLIAGSLAGVKIKISHTHTPIAHWQISRFKKFIYNLIYGFLIRFFGSYEIALTESIKEVKVKSGIPVEKIAVIPNGIDAYKFFVSSNERINFRKEILRKYHLDPSVKIIGNLSRTTKEKGHDILLKSFAEVLNNESIDRLGWTLMICGGGELEESLWNLAGSLGIKDRLIITGRFFDDDLKLKYYSAFDYFVFPSLAEGFGIVLIEALIMGLPVVCSDLAVLKEVGRNYCTFFKTGNFEDLAAKLLGMLHQVQSDEEKLNQENFVRHNYSLDKFGESYEALYEDTISS